VPYCLPISELAVAAERRFIVEKNLSPKRPIELKTRISDRSSKIE
jgi:hypothetical protein